MSPAIDIFITERPPDLEIRLKRGYEFVEEESYRMMMRLHEIGSSVARSSAPSESGALGESLPLGGPDSRSFVTAHRAVIGSNLPYVGAQEDALAHTGPGVWWPPSEPIEAWVMRKGMADIEDAESVAYLVRRKIATQGITPHLFMEAGYEAVAAAAPIEAETLAEIVAARIEGAGGGISTWYDPRGRGTLRFRGARGRFVSGRML